LEISDGQPEIKLVDDLVASFFIVIEQGEAFNQEELFNHCRRYLPAFKVPRRITQREEIPYNRVGKPLRKVLREELCEPHFIR
jgi:acyl-CoA synthetase (AMP-forming)/AMP-acid ligase II